MHFFLLVYFITNIFISRSENIMKIKNLNTLIQMNPLNCKNIKIPPVEDPVCVKINYKDQGQFREIYVLAINKYEIEYTKCNPAIQAAIVPMHNCDNKNTRNTRQSEQRDIKIGSGSNENNEDFEPPFKDDLGESAVEEEGETEVSMPLVGAEYGDGDENDPVYDQDSQSNIWLTKFESGKNEEDEENIKQLPDDYDLNIKDSVDFDEYKKSCPTVCPFRNNMVCAKCQHNIYRSFLSVCHLRSFSCKHPDEKLELIKRGPCVQASPFNNDLPKPKGKLIEPNDEDIVLKFINCRQNGKLYKNDPRCKFEDEIVETPAPE